MKKIIIAAMLLLAACGEPNNCTYKRDLNVMQKIYETCIAHGGGITVTQHCGKGCWDEISDTCSRSAADLSITEQECHETRSN